MNYMVPENIVVAIQGPTKYSCTHQVLKNHSNITRVPESIVVARVQLYYAGP